MKSYKWIMLLLFVFIIVGCFYFYIVNSVPKNGYSAQKSGFNNTSNDTDLNFSIDNTSDNIPTIETELASFSTKIKNKKDLNRQNNITITCNTLNNTIVKSGEIFSFCDTIGASTIERGYKEANIIVQGTEVKGLGGGNCQVSSTLYNAVLAIPEQLEVIERHRHSAPVPYIEEGKDAAISYRFS